MRYRGQMCTFADVSADSGWYHPVRQISRAQTLFLAWWSPAVQQTSSPGSCLYYLVRRNHCALFWSDPRVPLTSNSEHFFASQLSCTGLQVSCPQYSASCVCWSSCSAGQTSSARSRLNRPVWQTSSAGAWLSCAVQQTFSSRSWSYYLVLQNSCAEFWSYDWVLRLQTSYSQHFSGCWLSCAVQQTSSVGSQLYCPGEQTSHSQYSSLC